MAKSVNNIEELTINSIRMLGVQAVNQAKSGHPGIVLGAAPMMYALFNDHLRFNPKNPNWFNRDRFVLSAGHGSALLYSTLYHCGYNYQMQDLKDFRKLGSFTPGHPEYDLPLGIEVATGPLGQGLANAVGMALAESFLAAKYNKTGNDIIDHHTYVLCGDGDLQEGISQEAISFAGHFKLKKLIVLYDSNDVQLDSATKLVISENTKNRFEALEWNYLRVTDGNDYQAISKAIAQAQKSDKPTLIEVKTVIGFGATKAGTPAVHGAPLMADIMVVRRHLNWNYQDFFIPEAVIDHLQKPKIAQGFKMEKRWDELVTSYKKQYTSAYNEIAASLEGQTFTSEVNWQAIKWDAIINDNKVATRVASGNVLKILSEQCPTLFGGSADLAGSTKALVYNQDYTAANPAGRHVRYGVREFAMAAMVNGMTLHQGLIAFGSTFLVFSDYMKPALRLAALMHIPSLFIFSHDSIAVGEDGPTHEPVEQLAMLRTIPNFNVLRPADTKETIGAYLVALQAKHTPSALVLSRQDLPSLDRSSITDVAKGGYIISKEDGKAKLDIVLIATGSEVHLALDVQNMLKNDRINARVVSMPSTDLFDLQDQAYQEAVLGHNTLRVAIEMGVNDSWYKYVGLKGLIIGVNKFGASGEGNEVMAAYGFTSEKIYQKVLKFMVSKEGKK